MAQAIKMPKPGQTMEEASIVKWHKKEGDAVKKGDVLFEIETDKAVLEVESFFDGTLLKIYIKEEVTVPVNSVVAYMGTPGEKVPDTVELAPRETAAAVPAAAPAQAAPARGMPVAAEAVELAPRARPVVAPAVSAAPKRLFISPRARALAKDCAIDPSRVKGSGPGGRITESDVKSHLAEKGYYRLRISPAAKALAAKEGIDLLGVRSGSRDGRIAVADVEQAMECRPKKMSKMRQTIARRLTDSFTGTPHFYVTVSADMTDLLAFRKGLKEQGSEYTVTDFILKAVALTLREYPGVNSVTDGATVRWHGRVDLGMAVGLDDGLVVPAIRDADELSMTELHDAAKALAEKARTGALLPDEMTGSTFTVSNMGMLDVENFCAIINPGEAAILAISSTKPAAVPVNGEIKARMMMKMTLSVDHRIVDGKTGAEFVNAVRKKLEDVELWKSMT